MPPLFTINFRREAFRRERERSRRRLLAVAGWATYFGVMALLAGLYGLNCQTVSRRTRLIEGQVRQAKSDASRNPEWQPGAKEAEFVQAQRQATRLWSRRLERLAQLLPANAALASVAVNPDNLPEAGMKNLLIITGTMRGSASGDGLRSVVQFVSTLSADSVFSRGFSSIQLASSEVVEGGPPNVNFVVECR